MTAPRSSPVQPDYKIGNCTWCGNQGEVFRDNGRCDDCDSNVVRCTICKQDQHYENHCRHVFQDQNFEWRGAGFAAEDTDMKVPFLRLVGRMPAGFATDLRAAISSGRFYTWLLAPMIGGGGMLELHGMPDRDGRSTLFEWGRAMIRLGEGPHAEETADGYRWLASLYQRNTPKANLATIAWIDEWRSTWPYPA
jgi:hypothetical protein